MVTQRTLNQRRIFHIGLSLRLVTVVEVEQALFFLLPTSYQRRLDSSFYNDDNWLFAYSALSIIS